MEDNKIYYKFHGTIDVAEIITETLNRLYLRVKRPLCIGDVIIIDRGEYESYGEVIKQEGCFMTVWEKM